MGSVACTVKVGQERAQVRPGLINARLVALGAITGEFDDNEALVLTGRIIKVLSYRRAADECTQEDACFAARLVLAAQGHLRSSREMARRMAASEITQRDCFEKPLPVVRKKNGRVERFDPAVLLDDLTEAAKWTGEFDECEAMALTGSVVRAAAHLYSEVSVSANELLNLVGDVLVSFDHVITAGEFRPGCSMGTVEPIPSVVGNYLLGLERSL